MLEIPFFDPWIQLGIILNVSLAALLGSAIGYERDRAGKSAGPRTMALVAAAAAVIVDIGVVLNVDADFGDPTRSLHAIMTGIGFLGAGLIFSSKRGGVKGITTAATVFATAAMGVATGLGFQLVAGGMTLIIIIILRSTHMIDRALYSNDKDEFID
jgi:putative Mg2+ transporter-C (MgtC) family protein